MTKTLAEAVAYIDELQESSLPSAVQPFLLPPHTALAAVRDRLRTDSPILLGAQNAHWGPEGAATGEISMRMVADAGAALVEIGHSERRASFGETDVTVAAKTSAALAHGLIPLVCVGESLTARRSGAAATTVQAQVRAALSGLTPADRGRVVFAYEPVWAIGDQGRPATSAEIEPVLAAIAAAVADLTGGGRARALLYGGGVDQTNVTDLLGCPHVDGLFVGRAGWTAAGFLALLWACAQTRR